MTRARSAESSSTPTIRILSSSPHSVTSTTPTPTRGVYRSTDGGAHWKKVLFDAQRPNDVGAVDLAIDPAHPRTLYASLWGTRRPPWSVYAPSNLPGGGLYKSTDGGNTWHKLTGGLPTDDFVGKIGIAVAPSNPNRLYAVVDDLGSPVATPFRPTGQSTAPPHNTGGGIYISDDAGATWKLVNSEQRLWGRGWYFEAVAVDPDKSRSRLRHQHRNLYDARRRQDLRARQRRARRRRLPPDVDQSQRRQPHGALERSRHRRQRRRRANLEHLVQPAHRADLPHRRRATASLLALRRAAGLRRRRRRHLVALRPAQLPQLGAHLPRRRKRHRRARSPKTPTFSTATPHRAIRR